jgi:RimJ/RimL family protein N-acetyltransferase
MRKNEALCLVGEGISLIPYTPAHVPVYHGWMENPTLLQATASERLTLSEEFENCRTWHLDNSKCTFIILAGGLHAADAAPVGDVNLFLDGEDPRRAEVSIMVAVSSVRRTGCATEALRLLTAWSSNELGIRCFFAKIGYENTASVALFAKLGYDETSRSDVFREVTMELHLSGTALPFPRVEPFPCAWLQETL